MVSPQPPAFSCRFRRSTTSVIAKPVYKSRAYSRPRSRCLPPRKPHGSAANWSFQGRPRAANALEPRPIDVVCPADDVGSRNEPALAVGPHPAVERIVTVVAHHEVRPFWDGIGACGVERPLLVDPQDLVGAAVGHLLAQPLELSPFPHEVAGRLLRHRLAVDAEHATVDAQPVAGQADDPLDVDHARSLG